MKIRKFNESADWDDINDILNIIKDESPRVRMDGYDVVISNQFQKQSEPVIPFKKFMTLLQEVYDRLKSGGYVINAYVRIDTQSLWTPPVLSVYYIEHHPDKRNISQIPSGSEIKYCIINLDSDKIIN